MNFYFFRQNQEQSRTDMGTGGSSLSSLTGASLDADPLFSEKDPEVLVE